MKTCKFCGEPLFEANDQGYRTRRIDSNFCNNQCRNDNHNRKAKIKRAKKRAIAAINTLHQIEADEIVEAIQEISGALKQP